MADDLPPPDVPRSQVNLHSPRLRIYHFLIWIAITTVLITLSRSIVESWGKTHPDLTASSDWWKKRQRRWTHWLGVALFAAGNTLGIAGGLIDLFWFD